MKLTTKDFHLLNKTALEAAKAAGKFIFDYARQDISIRKKEAGDDAASQIITEVDLLSQDIILKHILPTCQKYDLGLLTEEMEDDLSRLEKDYFWCVDPLDGTLPFVENRAGYAVSVALVSRGGVPYLGVVYDPLSKIMYSAIKDAGAYINGKPWALKFKRSKSYKIIGLGGAAMNACWVLESESALFYKLAKTEKGGGCLWDYAATACLYKELGAWVSDMQGNPLELNRKDSHYMNHKGVLFANLSDLAQKVLG